MQLLVECDSLLLSNVLSITKRVMLFIQIIAPILLIIWGSIGFIDLMRNPDDDKKNLKKVINKFLAAALVFLIPFMLDAVIFMIGDNTRFSSCYRNANEKISTSNDYEEVSDKEKNKIVPNAEDYEKGVKNTNKSSTNNFSNVSGSLSATQRQAIIAAANSQLGVPYHTMHYGPKGSEDEGFGCAMFVSYCYNQVLFNGVSGQDYSTTGFYGSTYEYWGNVTNDGYNPHNKKFVEVSEADVQAGDVVAYITLGTDPYATVENCPHVALYTGNGRIIGSLGSGTSGPGIIEGDVSSQAYGTEPHYLRYVGSEN